MNNKYIFNDILFLLNSKQGDYFILDIRFHGVNFPANGPVMQKKILRWEPSTENMCVLDGVLHGASAMSHAVQGGGHYQSDFKSTYK